ncbi:NAD(P)-dependent oxidoreductase [Halobacteriales archaeon QH_3_68_24]|nr:MAG: NAD(P)-dependent oxidoreductase [Halobacteriales archaeon QH_3_68_24]
MARIAVTGAAGSVGREALRGLVDHDVTALTHREHDDIDGEVVEVTDPDSIGPALSGHDVVVHLAGNPSPEAEWDSVLQVNIDGTCNVYEAALEHDLDRVVFASTNHVSQMHGIGDRTRPETMAADAPTVRPEDPTRPDSYYAVSKVSGEALGSYYADRHGLEVVDLRIGWLLTAEELRDRQDEDDPEFARYARAMWLSPRDCQDVVEKAATADLPENPLTVNAVSRNSERYLSITETMRGLGYEPRDDSAAVCEDV